ncbi:MAG: HD domain-containing protein [Candidatus Zixiibacteriota bacterium]
MSTLDKAAEIAASAHRGQVDKYGQPYILHPIRVMARLDSIESKIVAILHDVVEDSEITIDDLRAHGFSDQIIEAVILLTKGEDQDYTQYVSRLAHNPLARAVKLADLEDNMDLRRMTTLTDADFKRLQRYHWAWLFLNEIKQSGKHGGSQ